MTESAANTLTMGGLSVFSNVLSQKGMVLHDIAYQIAYASLSVLAADLDGLTFGLAGDDDMTSVALDDPEVYDFQQLKVVAYGAPANAHIYSNPIRRDLAGLPGGGMLVPADRLFLFVQGVNLASACTVSCRFRFTIIDLSAQDYLELAQAMRVLK